VCLQIFNWVVKFISVRVWQHLSNFFNQYYKASGESMFCGWVPMSFGGIVGCQNYIVINDCDGIYVGELGFLTLRLLLGCVNVEGSSKHAKLVS
jgi:hypothetical protein